MMAECRALQVFFKNMETPSRLGSAECASIDVKHVPICGAIKGLHLSLLNSKSYLAMVPRRYI